MSHFRMCHTKGVVWKLTDLKQFKIYIYVCMYVCVYIYIYIYMSLEILGKLLKLSVAHFSHL